MSKKIVLLLILGVLAASLFLFIFKTREEMVDFEVNHQAAQRLRAGETLYRVSDQHYQFKYMPFSAFLYLPLTLVPLEAAKGIWFGLILFSFLGIVILSNKLISPDKTLSWFVILLPPLVLMKFFLREIQLGQINSIITLILLVKVWILTGKTKRSLSPENVWAGFCWGLAAALKPYALIFMPYFILKKRWLVLLTGFGFLAFAFCAPSFYYGFKGNMAVHKEWILTFLRSTPALLTSQDNVSIIAFFSKWMGVQSLAVVLAGVSVASLAILILLLIRKGRQLPRACVLESSVLLISIPLVSPLGWDYTFLMSFLGLTVILFYRDSFSRFLKILLFANLGIISLSLYDIMGGNAYAAFMSWSVLTINFLILIGYLSLLRIRRMV